MLPGLQPLAVGDYVLMRSAHTLWAIDLATGKRKWNVPVDDPLDAMMSHPGGNPQFQQSSWPNLLARRVGTDGAHATLSSDGRYVFSVEEAGPGGENNGNFPPGMMVFRFGMPGNFGHGGYNRLAAYDLGAEGKLKWQIGGHFGPLTSQQSELEEKWQIGGGPAPAAALRQSETLFLGRALALG